MNLADRIKELTLALGTDSKQFRTWITGSSSGDINGLVTSAKTSLVAAINEAVNGAQPKSANLTALSGVTLDTDVSMAANSDTRIATQAATKARIDQIIGSADAMVYKGNLDCSINPNYPAADAGWTYKVSVAGKIGGSGGVVVEVGDTVMCIQDATPAGNQAAVGARWNVSQANIDGAVIGPAASTAGNLAVFSGTTGKVIADAGLVVDTDGTMAANSDTRIPSQKSVRTYAVAKSDVGTTDTDFVAAYNTAKA